MQSEITRHRTYAAQTKWRLKRAIAEGATAKQVAALTAKYKRHKAEYNRLKAAQDTV